MKQKNELDDNNSGKKQSLQFTPYDVGNLTFKTMAISFCVSLVTQPFQIALTRLQQSKAESGLNKGTLGLYRGFLTYAIAGQKRGAVAVTAKQTSREPAEEEVKGTTSQRWLGTFLFSQLDIGLSSALTNKAKLQGGGIIDKTNFRWSFENAWKLTKINWGSRSIAGFINFAAIGFMGDYISSFYKLNNEFCKNLLGGATSGVVATLLTTIPNSYSDRKVLASKVVDGRLLTVTPFTMFNNAKLHVKSVGFKEATMSFLKVNLLKEVLVRSPQAAITFGLIFSLDHLMGPKPLDRVWPGRSANEPEEPSHKRPDL
ncbi:MULTISPECIES: hypothetical protein [Legionella]|uniref:Periplasmic ligand-binding sensor domain protein n=1 Tax=Legionella maceachernii TaxID=466 RepID=A0A0W0VX53_9GAMM|nr:hypothetical protein [Legionella maceachernii]KTD24671.1 periplasmic ligand-binding sensor domain protein [Legionella maceachernii]SKA26582.1 hypothetical protein SAMN02745128_02912 [Legionella maceachernii]SUP01872.1 Uncharacterised protein [Legionella maceachernii]